MVLPSREINIIHYPKFQNKFSTESSLLEGLGLA